MATVLLIRHGRTKANADGVLAGWTPGVALDETGEQQARRLAERLAGLPLTAAVTSPLERTRQTAALMLAGHPGVDVHVDERVGECRYGDWTGGALKTLAKDPMWKVVQAHPSAAVFPGEGGESMAAMQHRAVTAVREWNARLGEHALYAVVSHGDVIKAILADALGMHLDQFQRLRVDPCSVSVVDYTPLRPFIERTNDTGGSLASLKPPPKSTSRRRRSSDATVGGGAGA
jgi:probable phosphomutase (TIGR03848 family)